LGLPSIKLLYLIDELELPESTVKIIGHQWYWRYEYSDTFGSTFRYDSYMKPKLVEGGTLARYRLLEVDYRCVVAALLHMRALVTSEDVLHSWAIPSACIKVDAIPGRINQVGLCFLYPGIFYGQCSELCGVNHSFIPICVEAVTVEVFTKWIIGNHELNLNNSCRGWCSFDLWIVWKIMKKLVGCIYDVGKLLVKLYVLWWQKFLHYGIYVPIKYTLVSSVDLIKWLAGKCVSLAKWVGWFAVSPIDASIYAVCHISWQIYEVVWFAITKPFEFSIWIVKSVYKGVYKTIVFFRQRRSWLFNSIMMSISRFTDDQFKEVVVDRVNINTQKFLWIIREYYKNHK
jgi:hypothetical protein